MSQYVPRGMTISSNVAPQHPHDKLLLGSSKFNNSLAIDGCLQNGSSDRPQPKFADYATSGARLIRGSVNTSASSVLRVENSETIAPSGPAWNQCSVSGTSVYFSPGF